MDGRSTFVHPTPTGTKDVFLLPSRCMMIANIPLPLSESAVTMKRPSPSLRRQFALLLLAATALWITGCQRGGDTSQPLEGEESVATTSEDEKEHFEKGQPRPSHFEPGPTIDDPAKLLAALDGEERKMRLPVVVSFDVMGVDAAVIAPSFDHIEEDSIRLRLDDGAMGISLSDRIHQLCSDAQPCAVWLEGYWGTTTGDDLPGPPEIGDTDDGPAEHPFSVRAVSGLVEPPSSDQALRIELEVPTDDRE